MGIVKVSTIKIIESLSMEAIPIYSCLFEKKIAYTQTIIIDLITINKIIIFSMIPML